MVSITRASRAIPNNFPSETDRNPFTHPIFATSPNLSKPRRIDPRRSLDSKPNQLRPLLVPEQEKSPCVSTLFITPRIQPNPIDRRPKNRSLYLLRIEEAYLKKSLSIQRSSSSLSTIGQLELTRYNFQCPARYILDFTFTNNMRQPPACTYREREREASFHGSITPATPTREAAANNYRPPSGWLTLTVRATRSRRA